MPTFETYTTQIKVPLEKKVIIIGVYTYRIANSFFGIKPLKEVLAEINEVPNELESKRIEQSFGADFFETTNWETQYDFLKSYLTEISNKNEDFFFDVILEDFFCLEYQEVERYLEYLHSLLLNLDFEPTFLRNQIDYLFENTNVCLNKGGLLEYDSLVIIKFKKV